MRAPGRPHLRRILLAAALGLAAVVGTAGPASAHTVGGVDATNYRSTIRSVTPPDPHITVRVVDNGDRLQLTNTGTRDVVVMGYDGEPYLRVGPRGVFENARSPARYLNRVRRDPEPPPKSADPDAPPRWRKTGSGRTVAWHDHRAHWMGLEDPPVVQRAPGEEHLIQRFRIDLLVGDQTLKVRGDVRWIPGPSPWPWFGIAAVVVVATVLAARTRRAAQVLAAVLGVALVASVLHAVAAWTYATAGVAERSGDALPTVGAIVLGVLALGLLARRGLRSAAPLLVFAGIFLGIAIGLADMSAFWKSQLPTDLDATLDRLTIALALGGGIGVALGSALHIAERRPRPSSAGPSGPPAPSEPPGTSEPPGSSERSGTPGTENESHSMMQG